VREGATEFYGNVPKHSATFAWSEICATPGPEAALAPVPQVQQKSWYNTYVYTPEQSSHEDRQFLQRYVKGPDGEWIDAVKARRLAKHLDEQHLKNMREAMERDMVASGAGTQKTHYLDPYSGEHLVACRGDLLPKAALNREYGVHTDDNVLGLDEDNFFDFDNLRIPWPFGKPDRNKAISQHTYDWFDRRNMYIPNDRSVELRELPSMYLDREEMERWWHSNPRARDTEHLPHSQGNYPQPSAQQVMF